MTTRHYRLVTLWRSKAETLEAALAAAMEAREKGKP